MCQVKGFNREVGRAELRLGLSQEICSVETGIRNNDARGLTHARGESREGINNVAVISIDEFCSAIKVDPVAKARKIGAVVVTENHSARAYRQSVKIEASVFIVASIKRSCIRSPLEGVE